MISHQLFHSVHQLSRQLTKQINLVLQPYGLFSAQWAVLFTLKEKGSLTQKALCDYLSVEAPPMTRMVQRLVKQEYVRQVPGEDKRVKIIELTEKALKEYPVWEQAIIQMNSALVEGFPEDDRKLLQQLNGSWLAILEQKERKEEKN